MGIRAIDVSVHQGPIDWAAVRGDGVRAAWIKVGGADGGPYKDSRADENLAGAARAGLPYGTYYFCSPAAGNAVDQARHAVACGHGAGQLWPAADLEINPAHLSNGQLDVWLATFCAEVRRLTGRESLWYGGIGTGVGFTASAPHCPVWIANYGARDTAGTTPPSYHPAVPPAWSGWDVWQFNSVTRVAGITQNTVDQNVITDAFWARMTSSPTTQEALVAKPLRTDRTGDLQLVVFPDGNGRLRKMPLTAGDPGRLLAAGLITTAESVVLTGADADWLLGLPDVAVSHLAEQLEGDFLRLVGYLRDQVATPVAQLAGRPAGDVDEAALAQALAGPVAQLVVTLLRGQGAAAGIDDAKLDDLIGRVSDLLARATAAGQALAGTTTPVAAG